MKILSLITIMILLLAATSCSFFKSEKNKDNKGNKDSKMTIDKDEFDDAERKDIEELEKYGSESESDSGSGSGSESKPELAGSEIITDGAASGKDETSVGDLGASSNLGPGRSPEQSTHPVKNGETKTYSVKKGDTLMWISFQLYGNYEHWKSIAELNKDTLTQGTELKEGSDLKYFVPEKEFSWSPPDGTPYLIQHLDTLGTISKKVYETSQYWKYIFENNRLMIRNPNLIFAGFTLYYLPLNAQAKTKFAVKTVKTAKTAKRNIATVEAEKRPNPEAVTELEP